MSAIIGSGALKLSTDGTSLFGGLDKANAKMATFGQQANRSAMGGMSRLKSVYSSGWSSITSVFSSSTAGLSTIMGGFAKGGAIGAGIAAGLVAVKAGVEGVGAAFDLVKKGIDTIGELGKVSDIARALGASGKEMSGLLGVFAASGTPVSESIESLVQFGTAITNALEGKGENAQQLFSMLGQSAKDYVGISATEQFYKFHEAASRIADPLQKANAYALAFGTDGLKKMINLLPMSTEELRKQAEGFALTNEEVAQASLATKAWNSATAALSKVWQEVSIAFSPILQVIGEMLPKAIKAVKEEFGGWGNSVLPMVKDLSYYLGYVFDVLKLGYGIVKVFGQIFVAVLQDLAKRMKQLIDAVGMLDPGIMGEAWKGASEMLGKLGIGDSAKFLDKFWDDFDKKRNKGLADLQNANAGVATKIIEDQISKVKSAVARSKDAYDIESQFRYGTSPTSDVAKKQLDEQRKTNELLQSVVEGVSNFQSGTGITLGTIF